MNFTLCLINCMFFSADLKSLPPLHQLGQILLHMDAAGAPFRHSCWQTCSAWLTLGPSTAGGCGQFSLGSQFGRRSYIAESLRGSWLLSTRQQARGWGWFHTPSRHWWKTVLVGWPWDPWTCWWWCQARWDVCLSSEEVPVWYLSIGQVSPLMFFLYFYLHLISFHFRSGGCSRCR